MNAVKFFITLAVLVACIFAVSAEEENRDKRFAYFGGYGAYPYAAGYGLGYGGYGYGLGYRAYGAYGGYGGYGYRGYPAYGYHW